MFPIRTKRKLVLRQHQKTNGKGSSCRSLSFEVLIGVSIYVLFRHHLHGGAVLVQTHQASSTRRDKVGNVVLVGHFEGDEEPFVVEHWVKAMAPFFSNIEIRGDSGLIASKSLEAPLKALNVKVKSNTKDDESSDSKKKKKTKSLESLSGALRDLAKDRQMEGVLMVTKDIVLDITELRRMGFPSKQRSTVLSQTTEDVLKSPAGLLKSFNQVEFFLRGTTSNSKKSMEGILSPNEAASYKRYLNYQHLYTGGQQCLFPKEMIDHKMGKKYSTEHGLEIYASGASDFIYVPRQLAMPFANALDWMAEFNVFVDCALPTIIRLMTKHHGAVNQFVHWCDKCNSIKNKKIGDPFSETKCVLACLDNPSITEEDDWYIPKMGYVGETKPTAPFLFYQVYSKTSDGLGLWDKAFERLLLRHDFNNATATTL